MLANLTPPFDPDVLFNVTLRDVQQGAEPDTTTEIEIVCNSDPLPILTINEQESVFHEIEGVLRSILPLHDSSQSERWLVLSESSDRTSMVSLRDVSDLTIALREVLQVFLCTYRPLWRVVLLGSEGDTCITIYPNACVCGDARYHNLNEGVEAIRNRETILRERRCRPESRQIELVDRLLPEFIQRQPPEVCVAAIVAFDQMWNGSRNGTTVWLYRSDNGSLGIASPAGCAKVSGFNLLENGHLDIERTSGRTRHGSVTSWSMPFPNFRGVVESIITYNGVRRVVLCEIPQFIELRGE